MTTDDFPQIYWEELQGMRQRAEHYLSNNITKGEKRMAKDILKLVRWVECEGKANQEKIGITIENTRLS